MATIRSARRSSAEGEIFSPPTALEFRRRLRALATADLCSTILDDNPGSVSRPVSRDYPEGRAVATTPAAVLAILPQLPPDLEYRLAGHDLILLDIRANIVVDRIAAAIKCSHCDRRGIRGRRNLRGRLVTTEENQGQCVALEFTSPGTCRDRRSEGTRAYSAWNRHTIFFGATAAPLACGHSTASRRNALLTDVTCRCSSLHRSHRSSHPTPRYPDTRTTDAVP